MVASPGGGPDVPDDAVHPGSPTEPAETGRLAAAIEALLPALDEFNRFEDVHGTTARLEDWRRILDTPLPREGAGLDAVLELLRDVVIPNGVRIGAPGFVGWVTTQPTTSATAAVLAAKVAGAQRHWVTAFNLLETVAERWLAELLGIPPDWQGTFTSGGSTANLVGLGAARQAVYERHGIDPAERGLVGAPPGRIYASVAVHHVVTRAAAVLGLARREVELVPTDQRERTDLAALRDALAAGRREGVLPVAIVASAGTVNTGVVDPITELAEFAEEYDSWLHIDGAYGGFGRLDPRVTDLYEGWERAGSIAVDPHKWLAAPLGCGAAYVRDGEVLRRTFTLEPAAYLEGSAGSGPLRSVFDDFGLEPHYDHGVDQSAPSRGVTVWAVLQEIGAQGMRERVGRHLDLARHVAERARREQQLELYDEPTLSICCFRYVPAETDPRGGDAFNAELAARLRAETRFVPSTTTVGGRYWLRPCFINPRTHRRDADAMVDAVLRLGDELGAGSTS
jgi:aromatic-L-amino-acid/L-tryptophan decarboxylase